jgi:hypothetical protein
VAHTGAAMRDLRGLRYDPPGYAKRGARRTTFQSALEQCEQFQTAARSAGYATRPVQLFYALSQAGRAIVTASPRIGNQAWRVSGHGLTANTNTASAGNVTVAAAKTGLYASVAAALGLESLVPDEPTALGDLWPLLPEAGFLPLTSDALFPVLLFSPHGGSLTGRFPEAAINWIPRRVRDLYGEDPAMVKTHLDRYPALRESELLISAPIPRLKWESAGPGLGLRVRWRSGDPPLAFADNKTADALGVASYTSANDLVITPVIGPMSTGSIQSWHCGAYC